MKCWKDLPREVSRCAYALDPLEGKGDVGTLRKGEKNHLISKVI